MAPAIMVGTLTAADIKSAFGRYATRSSNLNACRRGGTARINLVAKVAGAIPEREAQRARQMLAQRCRTTSNNNDRRTEER
jgi:sRNA-binding protein